jgi:hypothetical protein
MHATACWVQIWQLMLALPAACLAVCVLAKAPCLSLKLPVAFPFSPYLTLTTPCHICLCSQTPAHLTGAVGHPLAVPQDAPEGSATGPHLGAVS